jgi:hypothetical protein
MMHSLRRIYHFEFCGTYFMLCASEVNFEGPRYPRYRGSRREVAGHRVSLKNVLLGSRYR